MATKTKKKRAGYVSPITTQHAAARLGLETSDEKKSRHSASALIHRLDPTSTLVVTGWLAAAAYAFWQVAVLGSESGAPLSDSHDYEVLASAHPLFSMSFWSGGRPPLTPLLWKLTGTPTGFALLLTVFGLLSWGLLAWTISRVVPQGWPAVISAWVILLFSVTEAIVQWDTLVLTEATSLSCIALLFTSAIWLGRRPTFPRALAFVVVALIFAFDRDSNVFTVGMLAIISIVVLLLWRMHAKQWVAPAVAASVGLLLVAAVTGTLEFASHRNAVNIGDNMATRIFPYPTRVSWFADHGMPDASYVDAEVRRHYYFFPEAGLNYGSINKAAPQYRHLESWLANEAEGTYTLWLVTHPVYDITAPFENTAYQGAVPIQTYVGTGFVPIPGLMSTLFGPWQLVLIEALAAVVLITRRRLWSDRVVIFVTVLAAVGLPAMVVAWQGDGLEVTRHMLEGNVETRVGVLILLLVGITGFSERPDAPPEVHWWAERLVSRVRLAALKRKGLGTVAAGSPTVTGR